MREIKFRAWDKKTNQFLSWTDLSQFTFDEVLNAPSEFILQQYTGLKDKNGKEIYEGDIVRMTFRENIGTFNVPDDILANGGYTGREDVYEGEVVYEGACFGINDKENGVMQLVVAEEDLETEVIGNIYENPELLNALNTEGE
jgi:uncharacterized phage protein (TIGR01671 family)